MRKYTKRDWIEFARRVGEVIEKCVVTIIVLVGLSMLLWLFLSPAFMPLITCADEETGSKYPATLLVTEVADDTYICISSDGVEYQFDGNGFKVGDCISAIMVKDGSGFKASDTPISIRKENWDIKYNFKTDIDNTLDEVDKLLDDISSLRAKIDKGLSFKGKFTWIK